MNAAQNLSKNLFVLRTMDHSSQTCFAEKLCISKSTLHEIERGHPPRLDTVECIARNLGIPVSLLLSNSIAPGAMGPMIRFLQTLQWYSSWSNEDQMELLQLVCQLSELLSKNFR